MPECQSRRVTTAAERAGYYLVDLDAEPVGGCNGMYADGFNARTFSGTDGSLPWSGDWQEVGEGDGPTSGDVGVGRDLSDYQLRLRDNDNGGEGVEREAVEAFERLDDDRFEGASRAYLAEILRLSGKIDEAARPNAMATVPAAKSGGLKPR